MTFYQDNKTRLTEEELLEILRKAGFGKTPETLATAYALVMRESSRYPNAYFKNTNGTIDRGLFQINSSNLSGLGISDGLKLYDPLFNANMAFKLSSSGRNWSAWAIPNTDGSITGWARTILEKYPATWDAFQEKFNRFYSSIIDKIKGVSTEKKKISLAGLLIFGTLFLIWNTPAEDWKKLGLK